MKNLIGGLILLKLCLLIAAGALIFSTINPVSVISQAPQPAATPQSDVITRPTSDPYTGDLARFDREKRAEKLQIERVMDLLKITVGKSVADIGAGGGWFSAIASRRVGSNGLVFAVDISADSVQYINDRKITEELPNILAILGKPDDPFLPAESVDAVLILNTYHEFAEPVKLLKNLRKSLRKGAMVGIIDRDGKGDDHGLDQESVIEELTRAGFKLKESHDFVEDDMDYFLVFQIGEQ